MLILPGGVKIPHHELNFQAIRAQGAGGQNVNKVASAIHLRFDIRASSLPEDIKQRLLGLSDQRISADGVIVIKAQTFRTQEQNRREACERLKQLISGQMRIRRKRIATRPSKASVTRRLDSKQQRARTKALRGRVTSEH